MSSSKGVTKKTKTIKKITKIVKQRKPYTRKQQPKASKKLVKASSAAAIKKANKNIKKDYFKNVFQWLPSRKAKILAQTAIRKMFTSKKAALE